MMSEDAVDYRISDRILGIDPGPKGKGSGFAVLNKDCLIGTGQSEPSGFDKQYGVTAAVIEMISCYGMAVGMSTFETLLETGRIIEKLMAQEIPVYLVPRKDIKIVACGTAQAKDANVRRAMLDRYEPSGGGSTPEVGTKKQPGPLYGAKGHAWPAIAAARFYYDAGNERGIDRDEFLYTESKWLDFIIDREAQEAP